VSGSKPRRSQRSARRKSPNDETSGKGSLDRDITRLIRRVFPDGIVQLPDDADEFDLDAAYPELRKQLAVIDGALLLYEREPGGGPVRDYANAAEDPTDFERTRSYLLMFLALEDERFNYSSEDQIEDEQGLRTVEGTGRIGCTVAISLLAPVAVVKFDAMEQYDDGSEILPQVANSVFDLEWRPIDPEQHFRSMMGKEAVEALRLLAEKIAMTLVARGIRVLPAEQLARQVAWLRAGDDTLMGDGASSGVTVLDAFFFEQL